MSCISSPYKPYPSQFFLHQQFCYSHKISSQHHTYNLPPMFLEWLEIGKLYFAKSTIYNILLISFFWHPILSLTPGAVFQIQFFISSLILSYTTGSTQQLSGMSLPPLLASIHLLNTPATMNLRRAQNDQTLADSQYTVTVYIHHLSFSLTMSEVPRSP